LDDDSSPSGSRRPGKKNRLVAAPKRFRSALGWFVPLVVLACFLGALSEAEGGGSAEPVVAAEDAAPLQSVPWHTFLSGPTLLLVVCLLALSAFFSSSETAFFSIQKPRLRVLRKENRLTGRLIVRMLDRPGQLLTVILVGNMLVNTIIGVVLGARVKNLFQYTLLMPSAAAYVGAVACCTAVLVLFGEITPKVFAVRAREVYARVAVIPLMAADRLLAPVCGVLLQITEFLFRVTRFDALHAAPYITDEELKSALADGGPDYKTEEEERQMIGRILEFHDVMLREALVPRPDVVALPEDATVAEALALFRDHEFSRMPVYKDDLDHIQGVLFAKDLLPSLVKGDRARPVSSLVRSAHYVPTTMSVRGFVKEAQRTRTHLAIVVDEYGGTEGIVTLEDAIEEVVGDILDENEEEQTGYAQIAEGVYRLEANLPLDELYALTGVAIKDEEHETLAGFLMKQSDKILEVGDQIRHGGVLFTVEAVDGKRAATVRMEMERQPNREEDAL